MNLRKAASEIVMAWFNAERAKRGDKFATESEMQAIESDPLAWLSMMRGVDAFELFQEIL